MTLNEVLEEWAKDCQIDQSELGNEAARSPVLHSKYLTLFSQTKINCRIAEKRVLTAREELTQYFKGIMTKEQLDEKGWRPFQGKLLKSEINEKIEAHPLYMDAIDKLNYYETLHSDIEGIMREIQNRNFHIKSIQKWKEWVSGA